MKIKSSTRIRDSYREWIKGHPVVSRQFSFFLNHKSTLFTLLAILSVSFSLIVRVIYMGPYYPGWDTLGPAHGLYLVSTQSFPDAFSHVFYSLRHFQFWNPTNSLLYTLIPGYLGSLWPWEYWGHLLTFTLSILTIWLILKALNIPLRSSWVILLAWGASPALLSYSVTAYPYITGYLPHVIAIWLILNSRIHKNWLLCLFICLAVNELSWNLYELGKTVFVVFMAAAIMKRNVPLATRVVWIITSASQIFMLWRYSGGNVGYFTNLNQLGVHEVLEGLIYLIYELFVSQMLAVPVMFIMGIISLFLFKRDKWLLFVLFMFQIGLVFLLTLKGSDMLRPRRFLMVEFYCIVLIVSMFREFDMIKRFKWILKPGLIFFLLAGNVYQILGLLYYIETPVYNRRSPLPYTYSQADYTVPSDEVDWFLEMRSRVDSGEKLILIYNISAYPENTTDPAGALERLYLYLGHERFVNSVFVFGSEFDLGFRRPSGSVQCRYSCIPISNVNEIETFLDGIQSEGSMRPEMFTVYYLQHQTFTYKNFFELDAAAIFAKIRKRFAIRLDSPKTSKYMRFKIAEKVLKDRSTQGFVIEPDFGRYELDKDDGIEAKPFSWRTLPLELIWVEDKQKKTRYLTERPWKGKPFSLRFSGTLHILEPGIYDFLLGSDDDAILSLDNQRIIQNIGSSRFQLAQRTLELKRGRYPVELIYTDCGGISHLLLDLNCIGRSRSHMSTDQRYDAAPMNSLFPNGLKGKYYKTTRWGGESKETGGEIHIGDTLEVVWTNSTGLSQKPWDAFSMRLEGTMVIPESGIYRFDLGSDDGSFLYVDDELIIDNGGNHAYKEKSIKLHLKAGKFAVRLDYFDIVADAILKLRAQRYW